MSLLI